MGGVLVGFVILIEYMVERFAVVAVSALPTVQNIFNFASRYDRALVVTRDTVLLTTILSMPALLVIAALLA